MAKSGDSCLGMSLMMIGAAVVGLMGAVAMVVVCGGLFMVGSSGTYHATRTRVENAADTPPAASLRIKVDSEAIKHIDGKYRYFFRIYNTGTESFDGEVKISLAHEGGSSTWDDTFVTERPLQPGGGTYVFTDAHTGPPVVHGDAGNVLFTYQATSDDGEIGTGSGRLRSAITR